MKTLGEKYQDNANKRPSGLQSFFTLCSGANKEILNEYPTEWNKFAGIGATIFLTACLALLSGSYAIHFVFDNGIFSILFGIFWAIVIFNLDRYIVLSLRKEKIPTNTDIKRETDPNKKDDLKTERNRLLWHLALMASPRFIIALIIAITVSKPIELRLFQNRIEKELERIVKTEDAKFDKEEAIRNEDLNNQLTFINKQEQDDKSAVFSNNPIYQDAKTKIPRLEANISEKEQAVVQNREIISRNYIAKALYNYNDQGERVAPYSKNVPNAIALTKMNENRALDNERQRLLAELLDQKQRQKVVETSLSELATTISEKYKSSKDNISQQIENLNRTYLKRKTDWVNANKRSADLPARLEALDNISSFGNSIWRASMIITLLFIALETAPVIVKLLTKRGPYDDRLDALEYQIFIEESRKIDTLNREINEYMKLANDAAKLSGSLRLNAEKDKLDIELQNNKELLNKLAGYQKELAEIYADAWFQEEKEKALHQAKAMQIQDNQQKQQYKLENIFWKQKGVADKIEYYFRNGSLTNNELLYFENEQLSKGKWNFNHNKNEVTISLLDNNTEYQIAELNNTILKLKHKSTNDIIEFEKI